MDEVGGRTKAGETKAVKTKKAEIMLVVRVRISGEFKDLDEAKVLARKVVESGSLEAAGLKGEAGTGSEGTLTLDGIKSGGVTFASMG